MVNLYCAARALRPSATFTPCQAISRPNGLVIPSTAVLGKYCETKLASKYRLKVLLTYLFIENVFPSITMPFQLLHRVKQQVLVSLWVEII